MLGALHSKLAEAEVAAKATREAQRAARGTPQASAARATHTEHRQSVRRLRHRIETATECIRGLSRAFHPVDLATGERVGERDRLDREGSGDGVGGEGGDDGRGNTEGRERARGLKV